MDLGKLEQDLVFGDASTKEVLAYLSRRPQMSTADKVGCPSSGLSACIAIILVPLGFGV